MQFAELKQRIANLTLPDDTEVQIFNGEQEDYETLEFDMLRFIYRED